MCRTPALSAPGLCLANPVQISAESGSRLTALFTGLVDAVELRADGMTEFRLSGMQRELETSIIAGMVVGDGTDRREVLYAMFRNAGFVDDKISMEGWSPGPSETFLVASPVTGVKVDRATQIGRALLTPVNPARMELGADPLVVEYEGADAWIYTTVEAVGLFQAEGLGLKILREAVSGIRAFANYSYPMLETAPRGFATPRAPRRRPR